MRYLLAFVALCAIGVLAAFVVVRDDDHWRDGDPRHASKGAFRGAVIALVACCVAIGFVICSAVFAHARPSPVTSFDGDRYSAAPSGAYGKIPQAATYAKARHAAHRRAPVARKTWTRVPVPKPRRVTAEPYRADAGLSVGGGIGREVARAAGRPAAWCGWWLGHHLGMPLRHLWLARNWKDVGTNAGGPQIGAVVVWRHHVGIITGRQGNQWIVKSGNDGRRVRERARSIAGAIAFRRV